MTLATIRLIEAVERLNMSGEIGDGMVANLHELATMARLEVAGTIPATNQAEEVRKPGSKIGWLTDGQGSAALATQPATSQEGEGLVAKAYICINSLGAQLRRSEITAEHHADKVMAILSDLAATPTPPTLSEDLG